MAKEGIPISKTFVREHIENVSAQKKYELSVAEQNIIDTILHTMPEKLNGPQLGKWCNAEVESILRQYPELKKRSDIIRNEVGKELKYFIHKDEFDMFKKKIEDAHLEKINPEYFSTHDKTLSSYIYANYRTLDGKTDWDFITKKLGITDIFEKEERATLSADKDEAMDYIVSLLKEANPKKFNPGWIQLHMPHMVKAIEKAFHKEGSTTVDWRNFEENLPDRWRKKFVLIKEYGRELPDVVKDMVRVFEATNPKQLYSSYIQSEFPKEYGILTTRILKPNGEEKPDWSIFLNALPKKWADRWMDRDKFEEITGKRW